MIRRIIGFYGTVPDGNRNLYGMSSNFGTNYVTSKRCGVRPVARVPASQELITALGL